MASHIGMYVHMHWGYSHPYAARTWTLDDWRGYAAGLSELGYDLIMIWPIVETMPDPPTTSDVAHLDKLHDVIDMLHNEFGMTVLVTLGANTVGNSHAAEYTFEERPFFRTDERLDPSDPVQVDRLMRIRRNLLARLSNANGFVIIDSDPGGYVGSTNAEFAALLHRHMEMLSELNPTVKLFYWIWMGWETYNRFWELSEQGLPANIEPDPEDWEAVVADLLANDNGRWRFLVCGDAQRALAERLGVDGRSIYLSYGLVEGEPTFPHTNQDSENVGATLDGYPWGGSYRGCMANAQTHVVQLPNTYFFAHVAEGGTPADADLPGFAERLLPGRGEVLARAWEAIAGFSSEKARDALAEIEALPPFEPVETALSGLLIGGAERYLRDLALQLAFTADIVDVASAVEHGENAVPVLRSLTASWRCWMDRTGFVDAYFGPVADRLHPALRALGDPAIDAVLDDFDDWRDPSVRNGIVPRLISALEGHCAG